MILAQDLRKGICISLLGHIAIFSIFSFSFGHKIPQADITNISFWGANFAKSGLISEENFYEVNKTSSFIRMAGLLKNKTIQEPLLRNSDYFPAEAGSSPIANNNWREKPQMPLTFNKEKTLLFETAKQELFISRKRESAIMFYPELPYNFALYFKDREVAHIELMSGVFSNGKRNSIAVKRKISSGNLEVDLLAIRYISRYLFIQQKVFIPNIWQNVKIDLSAKGH